MTGEMLIKKIISLLTATALILALGIFLPEGAIKATALGNISGLDTNYTHKYIFWNEYEGADHYKIVVTATGFAMTYNRSTPKFEYGDIFTKKGIVYNYSVTAMDSSGTALTREAKGHHVESAKITGVKVDEKTLTVSWDAFDGDFDYYDVNRKTAAGGSTGFTVDKTTTSAVMNLADQPTGTYEVWIDARKDFDGYSEATGASDNVSFEYTSKSNADVNADNDVTVKDVTLVKQKLAKWNVELV